MANEATLRHGRRNAEPPEDRLMTSEDVALYVGVPTQTVHQWRSRRCGPAGMRVGRYVRYRRRDVDAWLDERKAAS